MHLDELKDILEEWKMKEGPVSNDYYEGFLDGMKKIYELRKNDFRQKATRQDKVVSTRKAGRHNQLR